MEDINVKNKEELDQENLVKDCPQEGVSEPSEANNESSGDKQEELVVVPRRTSRTKTGK